MFKALVVEYELGGDGVGGGDIEMMWSLLGQGRSCRVLPQPQPGTLLSITGQGVLKALKM